MVGFDKVVDTAKTTVANNIDMLDSNVVLKFYNKEVMEEDIKNEKTFDNLVVTTKQTGGVVMNKAYKIDSSLYNSWAAKK